MGTVKLEGAPEDLREFFYLAGEDARRNEVLVAENQRLHNKVSDLELALEKLRQESAEALKLMNKVGL